jgi:hypothetical protein
MRRFFSKFLLTSTWHCTSMMQMKKLLPQALLRIKALLIMAGLATALVSETFAAPTPTPSPTPKKLIRHAAAPPPVITPYSG